MAHFTEKMDNENLFAKVKLQKQRIKELKQMLETGSLGGFSTAAQVQRALDFEQNELKQIKITLRKRGAIK